MNPAVYLLLAGGGLVAVVTPTVLIARHLVNSHADQTAAAIARSAQEAPR